MKSSLAKCGEIDFNIDYIKYRKKQTKDIKENLDNLICEYNTFKKQIFDCFKNFETCFPDLLNEVDSYIKWLQYIKYDKKIKNINNNECYIKNIYVKFEKCYNCINIMKEKDYINKLNKLNKKLLSSIKGILDIEFYPPKNGSLDVYSKLSFLKSMSISDSEIESDSNNPNNYDNFNNENNSENYHENFEYLNENREENNSSFNIDQGEDIALNLNNDENNINNISNIERNINKKNIISKSDNSEETNDSNNNKCLKCTYCINVNAFYECSHCNLNLCQGCYNFAFEYEQISYHILNKIPEYKLDIKFRKNLFLKNFIEFSKHNILKCNYLLNLDSPDIEYPFIEDINNLEAQKEYLQKINKLCQNENNNINNINNINKNNKNEIKLDENLIIHLENMFKHKKIHISDEKKDIDDNFFDENNSEKNEFESIKNDLLYFITIVTKDNEKLDEDIYDEIRDRFSDELDFEKNNIFILFNEKVLNFAKSTEYLELKDHAIQIKNPIFNKLNEIKLLIDNLLCKECQIPKEYLDSRGNTLYPNSSFNIIRGTELYDPPYGYIGIGLKVIGKYENDDWLNNNFSGWAIAYHSISSKLSSNIIKKLLNDILTKNCIKKGISKFKSELNDKRNWGKVGEGIYLTPNIKNAEKTTGIISFNNKKYKVIFMAKVYIKAIREPENTNFWVLDEKNIRIYRILFKEIK